MRTPFLKPRPKTEKATEVENNPPAATPLPSVWLPDDDPKPRVNTSYKKCQDSLFQSVQGSTQAKISCLNEKVFN